MNTSNKILLPPAAGPSYWVLGDLYTFKATGKQTGGTFTLMDQVIQPGGGPPPHIHHREDEAFYILEGRFSFLHGGQQSVLEAGAFMYVPRGLLHTFKNIGEKPGRLLVTVTPAGLEEFFYAIGTPAADRTTPPPPDPAVIGQVLQLAEHYHMSIHLPG